MTNKNNQFSILKQAKPSEQKRQAFRHLLTTHIDHSAQVAQTRPVWRMFAVSATSGVLALSVVVFSTLNVAAHNTLPGDRLYSFKTGVSEELRALLITSPRLEASWQTERLERRLQEAERLASEGRLNEETSGQLSQKITNHVANARTQVSELKSNTKSAEAVEAEVELDSTLKVYGRVFTELSEGDESLSAIASLVMSENEVENETPEDDEADETPDEINKTPEPVTPDTYATTIVDDTLGTALTPDSSTMSMMMAPVDDEESSSTSENAESSPQAEEEISPDTKAAERVLEHVQEAIDADVLARIAEKQVSEVSKLIDRESERMRHNMRLEVLDLIEDAGDKLREAQAHAAQAEVEAALEAYREVLMFAQDAKNLLEISESITPESLEKLSQTAEAALEELEATASSSSATPNTEERDE